MRREERRQVRKQKEQREPIGEREKRPSGCWDEQPTTVEARRTDVRAVFEVSGGETQLDSLVLSLGFFESCECVCSKW